MVERESTQKNRLLSNANLYTAKELGKKLLDQIQWRRPTAAEYEYVCRPINSQKSYSIKGGVIRVGEKEAKVYKCHFYKCPFAVMSLMTPEFKKQYQEETGKSGAFLWHPDHTYITCERHDHDAHLEEAVNVEVLIKNVFKTRDNFFNSQTNQSTTSLVNKTRAKDIYTQLVREKVLIGNLLQKEYKYLIVGTICMVQLQIRNFIHEKYLKKGRNNLPGIPELLEEIGAKAAMSKGAKKATLKEAMAMMKGETYESIENKQGKKLSRRGRKAQQAVKDETESRTVTEEFTQEFTNEDQEELKVKQEEIENTKHYKESLKKHQAAYKQKVLKEATESILGDPNTFTSEATQKLVDFDNELSELSNQVSDTSEYEAFKNSAPASASKRVLRSQPKSTQEDDDEELVDQQLRQKEQERVQKVQEEYRALKAQMVQEKEQYLATKARVQEMRDEFGFELEGL